MNAMKPNRRDALGVVSAGLLALAGCGGREEDEQDESSATSGKNFALQANALLLDGAAMTLVAQDDTSMTVSGKLPALVVGNVIVSTMGDGALRRIKSIQSTSAGTRLVTEPAALHEAFSRFALDYDKLLQPADLGNAFSTGDAELLVSWATQTQATAQSVHPSAVSGPGLKLEFKKFSATTGISLDGDAHIQLAPHLTMDLVPQAGSSIPVLTYSASINPAYSHSLQITSQYGGSLSTTKSVEFKLGRIVVPDPPIVIIPVVKVKGGAKGVAAGKFSTTHTASISGYASIQRGANRKVTTQREFQTLATGKFEAVEGSVEVQLVPAEVELMFKLYGVGGPYLTLSVEDAVTATFERNGLTGQEGVRAKVNVECACELGVGGDLGFLKSLLKDAGGDFELVSYKFPLLEKPVFDAFFPFTSLGSIVVRDNGNTPDDIFEVALDGAVLGRTTKGGTGQFRVSSLRPGNHTLRVATVEDDDPPGTWQVSLSDGLIFSDGTTTKEGLLTLGNFVTFTLIAP